MKKVYFWEQIFLLRSLADYEELLATVSQKILSGNYAAAGIEKLQHGSKCLYSARINEKARVIFTSFNKDGISSILILDVLENHQYEKCNFMDNRYIRDFFGRVEEESIIEIKGLEEMELAFEAPESAEPLALQRVHYFQGQMIELSPGQIDALSVQVHLPALIEGEAGSGKTCVGLCSLSDYLNAHPDPETKVLYLAPFPHLLTEMRAHWAGLNGDARAEFRTYDELFTTAPIHSETLLAWLGRVSIFSAIPKDLVLKEFSMMMVVPEKKHYLALGERQSIFTSPEEKNQAWDLFETFKTRFNFLENYHPWFSPLNRHHEYDLIYVDESQSFTPHQLFQIMFLAKERAMIAGFDRHQRIHGDRRDMLRFQALCHHRGIPLMDVKLTGSFRCPQQVIELINNLLSIKYQLAQGRPDKKSILKYESKKSELGQVHFYHETEALEQIQSYLPAGSTNWAVITQSHLKTNAQEVFNTPLIFTPQEILGLGYDFIVLYRMGQQDIVAEMSRELKTLGTEEFKHGAKKEIKETYLSCLNEWIIAASRSHQGLLIVEPSSRRTHPIKNFLARLFKDQLLAKSEESREALVAQTDWESEILRLVQKGSLEQASAAYIRFIKPQTRMELDAWLESKKPPMREAACKAQAEPAVAETTASETKTSMYFKEMPEEMTSKAADEKLSISIESLEVRPALTTPTQVSPTRPTTFVTGRSSFEMYKFAGLRLILDNLSNHIENEAFYKRNLQSLFHIKYEPWKIMMSEEANVTQMREMIDRHAELTVFFDTQGSHGSFFQADENYCEFLSYRLSPEAPPFFLDFMDDEEMNLIKEHMIEHPKFLHIEFLTFLVSDINLNSLMLANKTSLIEFLKDALISYFDIVLQKEEDFIVENMLKFNNFFLQFILVATKLTHKKVSNLLLKTMMTAPLLWDLMGVERWSDIMIDPRTPNTLLTMMLYHPQTIKFLELMIINRKASVNRFLMNFLCAPDIHVLIYRFLSSQILANILKAACQSQADLYKLLKDNLIAKNLLHEVMTQPNSLQLLITLTELLPDIWAGNFLSTEVIVYESPGNTRQCSLILKILIDAQRSGIANIHEKVLQLFLTGSRPFYQEIYDIDWIFPMLIDKESKKLSWVMSPLFLMAKYSQYHSFLKTLLTEQPALVSVFKWIHATGLFAGNNIQASLDTTESGKYVWGLIESAADNTYDTRELLFRNPIFVKKDVESFCKP